MEETIKQRLITFIEYLGISTRSFEGNCNLSFGYIANLKSSPSANKIMKILNAYPDLSQDWLLTGEGEMLRGGVRQTSHGDNSPNINGDNNHLGTEFTPEAALKEIEAQRKLTERAMALLEKKDAQLEKKDEQISHLLSLLHK